MTAPFLIIGGYGTVGSHLIKVLREFQPELPLALAGRNADKAAEAAALYDNAIGVAVDTTREDLGLGGGREFSGIALLTNDLSTNPAKYALRNAIPYTSIATQLTHIAPKLALHIQNSEKSVSLLLDTSFAGTLVMLGLSIADQFSTVRDFKVGAVMDDADLGGPAATSDHEDYAVAAAGLILENGIWKRPTKEQENRTFTLLDGSSYDASSFPSIDLAELVAKTNALSARLDFIIATTPQRQAGGSPSVEIIYEIEGKSKLGEDTKRKVQLTHPLGQSYLTAVGVAVAIETLVGAVGVQPKNGIYLPSSLIDADHMRNRLIQSGAVIIETSI